MSINACDDYRTKIEKQTPLEVGVKQVEVNAMVSCVVIAKRVIDSMHPREREVHPFDRERIREIEDDLRERLADASDLDDGDRLTVELSADEVIAVQEGLVEMQFRDDASLTTGMKLLDGMFLEELTV